MTIHARLTTFPEGQIYNDDCNHILPDIPDNSVHAIITDPPYHLDGLDESWRKGKKRGSGVVKHLAAGMRFDRRQSRQLQEFIRPVGEQLLRVMKPGAYAVFFSQPRLTHGMTAGLEDAGFDYEDLLLWHFTNMTMAKGVSLNHFIERSNMAPDDKAHLKDRIGHLRTPQLRAEFESVILMQKPWHGSPDDNFRQYGVGTLNLEPGDGTILAFQKQRKVPDNPHPTVKPVPLMEKLIRMCSQPGQTVLDPFLGSGTTAVAAVDTGRRFIGIERDPEYTAVARRRLRTAQSPFPNSP